MHCPVQWHYWNLQQQHLLPVYSVREFLAEWRRLLLQADQPCCKKKNNVDFAPNGAQNCQNTFILTGFQTNCYSYNQLQISWTPLKKHVFGLLSPHSMLNELNEVLWESPMKFCVITCQQHWCKGGGGSKKRNSIFCGGVQLIVSLSPTTGIILKDFQQITIFVLYIIFVIYYNQKFINACSTFKLMFLKWLWYKKKYGHGGNLSWSKGVV